MNDEWLSAVLLCMGEDRTDETPDGLRQKAMRYRAMVLIVSDQRIANALVSLAGEYEELAEQIEKTQTGTH